MDPNSNPSLALCYVTLGRSAVTFSEAFLGIPSFKDYAYSPRLILPATEAWEVSWAMDWGRQGLEP